MIHFGNEAATAEDVGGKAAALGRMTAQGFDVPAFFAIPSGHVPTDHEVREALRRLGKGPYAVRSSGLAEDGATDSHAGQYETKLDVKGWDVSAAIADVLASAEGSGLAAYRRERGVEDARAPGVVVQVMAHADFAGVAFSADPVSGRRDRIVMSAIAGLGEALVAGEVDGSSWWVDRDTSKVVSSTGDGELLDAERIEAVADLVRRVEAACGTPQDIEWAFVGDRLHLLQARPITSTLRDAPLADPGIAVFDNSNIVESYPGIVSPLTFSFAQYAYARVYVSFVEVLGVTRDQTARSRTVFENMLVRVDGRVYYNLGNWYRALALLPGYSLNRAHMETMMGVGEPLPEVVASTIGGSDLKGTARVGEWSRVVGVGIGLLKQAVRLPRTAADFRRRLDRALEATTHDRLATMAPTELATEYRRIETELLDRWDAPIVNDFLCMMAFGASRRLLERWLGPDGLEIHNDLLIGQGDIVSARPPRLIRAMGTVAAQDPAALKALADGNATALDATSIGAMVRDYVAEFGDRCTEELKLESVTLDEDPRSLHSAILASTTIPARAPEPERDAFARFDAAMARMPVKRMLARPLLAWTRARVRDRENLRYERTRIFGRARRLFLAAGRQFHASGMIDDPRDVFMLTVDEVLGTIEGFATTRDLAGLVAVRKAETTAFETMQDPPERILVKGPAHTASGRRQEPKVVDGSTSRTGTGCSAGVVRAVARVVRDPRSQSIAPCEILVARHTDPGWIALFASASAIVVERGSLLSHSAIVAREMGIPCVVGLSNATDWIEDGQTILVDGSTGLVSKENA